MSEQSFSLLWEGLERKTFEIDNKTLQDINITSVLSAIFKGSTQEVPAFMKWVTSERSDICYRQELLKEFVGDFTLFESVKRVITTCHELQYIDKFSFEKEATLYNLINRIDQAAEGMLLVESLHQRLKEANIKSKGLCRLKEQLEGVMNHPLYSAFKTDVKSVKAMDEGVKSVKLGVNLDESLKPKTAMLLSLHENTFMYTRLLKKAKKAVNHGFNELLSIPRRLFFSDTIPAPLALNNLEKMIEPAMKQLIIFCDQFIEGLISSLAALKQELPFYEIGLKLYNDLITKGFPLCCPELCETGNTNLEGAYNINLAFEFLKEMKTDAPQQMIYNNLNIEEGGNIFILTGANRGGKTTFTQAIGQIFWLGHLGYFVPARQARLCRIDGLFAHFPSEESPNGQQGRLGEECKLFSELFEKLTPRSLLLMNESFSGTSHLESLTISIEAVKALKAVGATALFNTHLHELGRLEESINEEMDVAPKLVSLVAGTEQEHQSFLIQEGPPLGQSYAQDIAIKYGMTFEQLVLV